MNKKTITDEELREQLKNELKAELLQEMKEELLESKKLKEETKKEEQKHEGINKQNVKEKHKEKEESKETQEDTKEEFIRSKQTPSKNSTETLKEIKYNILWEGKPCGLLQRFLTKINLNFTTYQITKDELIIITGFFKRRLNSYELYLLKDPDLTDNIYQRLLNISTISVKVDTHITGVESPTKIVKIKNIENGSKVRKLLRDAIEADVMERKITYFDKV